MADWVNQQTVWGPIVDGFGRIGIRISVKETSTQVELAISTLFWTKDYTSYWGSNTATYFDNLSYSGSATTYCRKLPVNDGEPDYSATNWKETTQFLYDTHYYTYTKGTTTSTRYIYAKLSGVACVDGTMYANTTYTIPKLDGYTVAYDANGGIGEPSSQIKPHGVALTLTSVKPTRVGHTFQGWATSAGGSVVYSAEKGMRYTTDANITLYAVWKANTYDVVYNANGGSGAPPNQTKTYGVPLTLSYAKPTRTNYAFVGWGTSAAATTVAYTAGDSYEADTGITLYAIWTISYTKPRITNLKVSRCNSDKTLNDQGTCALVSFDWDSDRAITGIKIEWKPSGENAWTAKQISQSGTSGSVSECIGSNTISIEYIYDIKITVADSFASMEAIRSLAGTKFVIDLLGGGDGISFGGPASMANYMDVNFYTRFRQPVHFDNSRGIFGKTTDAEEVSLLYLNSSNETYVGYGGYNNRIGRTNLYGNELNLFSNSDVNINPTASGITNVSGATVNVSANTDVNLSANTDVNLSAKNNVNVKSPLHLEVTTDASGTANNNPALTIGPTAGTHLEFDGNEIISKSSANTPSDLYINSDGGDVHIHDNGVGTTYVKGILSSQNLIVNGCSIAANKVLWSGSGRYMSSDQEIPLSSSVSSQANGIVLVWSSYDPDTGSDKNSGWNMCFVPKYFVSSHGSNGMCMRLNTSNGNTAAFKFVRIYDTKISGSTDNNLPDWTTGANVRSTPRKFVLRYVIGV